MFKHAIALAAALATAAPPCLAAELPDGRELGARRSGAVAGFYLRAPLSRLDAGAGPRAGLRLSMTHDFREPAAVRSQIVEADALDLRLVGRGGPALYVAGAAMTGKNAVYLDKDGDEDGNGWKTAGLIALGALLVAGGGLIWLNHAMNEASE